MKEKQIKEMVKFICMDCRHFMQCNDDEMCDGRTLGEILKENCWVLKYAEKLYNEGYRKQKEGTWTLYKNGSGVCSECGRTQINMYDQDSWQNYCGHCGAKMTAITTKGLK